LPSSKAANDRGKVKGMTTVTLRQAMPLVRRPVIGVRFAFSATWASVNAVGRWMAGSGGGPRGYHREGFPEHEMHQVIAGRRDRFEGM
jgi:hypothetical protein